MRGWGGIVGVAGDDEDPFFWLLDFSANHSKVAKGVCFGQLVLFTWITTFGNVLMHGGKIPLFSSLLNGITFSPVRALVLVYLLDM